MEEKVSQGLHLWTWIKPGKIARKQAAGYLQFLQQYAQEKWRQICNCCQLHKPVLLKAPCFPKNVTAPGKFPGMLDGTNILKSKSEEIEPYLNGRCIYLVGMMGCGKSTVGKILAEALGYSFSDCDTIIEQTVGGNTVAEIFKLYGESFFRENETEVLQKLSSMNRLVVSTGGGAVVRPINWTHMQKGIIIWLDVPLDALARRITAVGTRSRPLLHHESGDPYSKTMKRLSTLFEERGEAYANADARVSLQNIAAKFRVEDVCNVTPTAIAIEVLLQVENFLKK